MLPGDAGRHGLHGTVFAGAVGAGGHAHDLGEARTERTKRRGAHLHARLRDAGAGPQQRHGTFDPPGHEVVVRRLTVGGLELAGEMRRGHQGAGGHGGHVQRLGVLAVDQVTGAAQVRQVGQFLRCHGAILVAGPVVEPVPVVGLVDTPAPKSVDPNNLQCLRIQQLSRSRPCIQDPDQFE